MSIQSAERVDVVSLTDAVRPHLDDVRARARATENARQQTPETIELIKELGLVRALVPKVYGGLEHDVYDWLQALRLLSTADMSAGWVAGLASAHSFVITKFDKRVQDEIWGELGPDAIVSSATALFDDGIAQPTDGGYTLSGRWRFASGITAADWVMALIKVPVADSGEHAPYWALIPKSDFTIDDTWRVSGMRGSGSHDFTVDNIFIPDYRLGGPGLAVEPTDGPLYDNPLYTLPFLVIFPIIFAPVAVGGAEAAVELFRTQLATRKAALSGVPLKNSALSQVRLAEAAMRTRAMVALIEKRWQDVADHVRDNRTIDPDIAMWWRVDDAYVGHEAVRIAEHIIEGAGASIYYEKDVLQRFWRDLHSVGGHTHFNTDSAMQILGRHLLDLEPDPTLI